MRTAPSLRPGTLSDAEDNNDETILNIISRDMSELKREEAPDKDEEADEDEEDDEGDDTNEIASASNKATRALQMVRAMAISSGVGVCPK